MGRGTRTKEGEPLRISSRKDGSETGRLCPPPPSAWRLCSCKKQERNELILQTRQAVAEEKKQKKQPLGYLMRQCTRRPRGRLVHECGSLSNGNVLETNEGQPNEERMRWANDVERELRLRRRKARIMRKNEEGKNMTNTKRRK